MRELPDTTWVPEILNHPDWPKMEELIFGDAQKVMAFSLVVRKDCRAPVQAMLTTCGLDVPEDHEEQLRVYIALRSVVAYLTDKKMRIETLKNAHQEKMRRAVREPQTTLQQGR